ncbi:MAG TPA: hypothetical protein PKI46_08485 [Bacteroidales bacterium]|nr:hypothetical protein [Bacteroidales bacterium]
MVQRIEFKQSLNAIVLDFSSEHTSDMNKFIKNLKKFFDKSEETYIEGFDEVKNDIQIIIKKHGKKL